MAIGFVRCEITEVDLEPGYVKVSIFADEDGPTHMAKRLPSGKWSSKLGVYEDIEHVLDALTGGEGEEYGKIVQLLKKKLT